MQLPDIVIDIQSSNLIALGLVNPFKAYAPYLKFAIAVAVKCKSGAVFVGANVENQLLGLAISAERVAMGAAVAAVERYLVAIAVISDSDEPILACGACRRFLAEFNPDLIIVSATARGGRKIDSLPRLRPAGTRGILKTC